MKEYHSFLFHSLTNQGKDHEQIFALLLHSDQILTSSVRIRNSVCTCLDGFKAGSKLVSFSRVSSLFRVSRVQLGALLWKLCWLTLRDVTGKALPSSEVVEFVVLRLWHGLGLLWLVSL